MEIQMDSAVRAKKFRTWINRKIVEHRGDRIRYDISDFADYVGIPRSTIDSWRKAKVIKSISAEHIAALVAIYGLAEVAEALGLTPGLDGSNGENQKTQAQIERA